MGKWLLSAAGVVLVAIAARALVMRSDKRAEHRQSADRILPQVQTIHEELERCLFSGRPPEKWGLGAAEHIAAWGELDDLWVTECVEPAQLAIHLESERTRFSLYRYQETLRKLAPASESPLAPEKVCEIASDLREELALLAQTAGKRHAVSSVAPLCELLPADAPELVPLPPPAPGAEVLELVDRDDQRYLFRYRLPADGTGDRFAIYQGAWAPVEGAEDGDLRMDGVRYARVARPPESPVMYRKGGAEWVEVGSVPEGHVLNQVLLGPHGPVVVVQNEEAHYVVLRTGGEGRLGPPIDMTPADVGEDASCRSHLSDDGDLLLACILRRAEGELLATSHLGATESEPVVREFNLRETSLLALHDSACDGHIWLTVSSRLAEGVVALLHSEDWGRAWNQIDGSRGVRGRCVDDAIVHVDPQGDHHGAAATICLPAGDCRRPQKIGGARLHRSADGRRLLLHPRGEPWAVRMELGETGFRAKDLVRLPDGDYAADWSVIGRELYRKGP